MIRSKFEVTIQTLTSLGQKSLKCGRLEISLFCERALLFICGEYHNNIEGHCHDSLSFCPSLPNHKSRDIISMAKDKISIPRTTKTLDLRLVDQLTHLLLNSTISNFIYKILKTNTRIIVKIIINNNTIHIIYVYIYMLIFRK